MNPEIKKEKITVCIPTYWTSADGKPSVDKLVNIYDHPTPINSEGTLDRALVSLSEIKGNFNVVIIGTTTEPDEQAYFQEKLIKKLSKFNNLEIYLFSHNEQEAFHKILSDKNNAGQKKFVDLDGYSNIRNLCLILPHILGSDLALLVDDDQVVQDKDMIEKAQSFIGDTVNGETVLAKTGLYISEDKKKTNPWWEHYWPKEKSMHEVFTSAQDLPRLTHAKIALGGAMVVHRNIFEKISFDPWALRGEDIDYLINCKLHGIHFFLDNEFTFLHLPPKHLSTPSLVKRQDMYRFMYEKEKIEYAFNKTDLKHFNLEDLDPYPGYFLQKDIYRRALSLGLFVSAKDIFTKSFFKDVTLIKTALIDAKKYAKRNKSRWFGFQKLWPLFIEEIKDIKPEEVLTKIN